MRKVSCIICNRELAWVPEYGHPAQQVCVGCGMEHGERLERAAMVAYIKEAKKIKEKIKEELENDEPEKCAHCGKSLAGLSILTHHITRAGKFCSKECYYNAGIKTKKES